MDKHKKKSLKREKRAYRTRNKFPNWGEHLRVSVFRSDKHIYAQLIDDSRQHTLAAFSSKNLPKEILEKEVAGIEGGAKTKISKKEQARQVGKQLAKAIQELSLQKRFFFDRGRFLYHGRVKEVAEGLREGGIRI